MVAFLALARRVETGTGWAIDLELIVARARPLRGRAAMGASAAI